MCVGSNFQYKPDERKKKIFKIQVVKKWKKKNPLDYYAVLVLVRYQQYLDIC